MPGCVPLGQGIIVFDFMSEAEDRDRIAHRDDRGARDQVLPAQPEHEGGQVLDAGHRELPKGTGRHSDVYPRRPAAGGGRGADVPGAAVGCVARQVGVAAAELASCDWSGRPVKNRRAQIRAELGLREPAVSDEDRLAD